MSEVKNLEKIKKFWPEDAPDANNVPRDVKKYKKDLIVIKYGGNVLIDRKIFMFFPLFLTIILAPFPAGLVVYWTMNNVLTIAQQWVIMRSTTVKTK